ncbi:MAG TPA: DUF222 domain-containing protein [Acidimicrobiales bacterium]|nr:DUF222 domain-containing protein [Acidimicrobiales bacterium]
MQDELRRQLSGFEPELMTPSDAASVLEASAEVERLAGSLKLLAAKRAAESSVWVQEGHRSAAGWLSELQKSSYGEGVALIDTASKLQDLAATQEALRSGELSGFQVKELAQAAAADPEAEGQLLRVAAEGTMKKLKDAARNVRAKAASEQGELARYRAIHRRRYFRHWSGPDGAFRFDGSTTADRGARLLSALQAEADRIFEEARKAGEIEPSHAYAADALYCLVTGERRPKASKVEGSGPTRSRTDTVVVRVDASALRRGFVKGEETCEIQGVGPVPVAQARRVLGDCFLKILVKDGVDVKSVCHVGRTVPAHLQSALEERDRSCVVPGCDVSLGLENHHYVQDYVKCRTTSLDGLARICSRHHDHITYDGFELAGGPGSWRLVTPSRRGGVDTS